MSETPTVLNLLATLKRERADLQREIETLKDELARVDALIEGVEKRYPAKGPYSGLTLRQAILKRMLEAKGAIRLSDLASSLQERGIDSAAKDFRNAVAATLSQMMNKWKEVESRPDGGWALTTTGQANALGL